MSNNEYCFSFNVGNSVVVSGGLCDIQATLQVHDYREIQRESLAQYINILRIESKSKQWQRNIEKWLNDFNESVDINDAIAVTDYVNELHGKMQLATFKKRFYQIRRYLNFLDKKYLDKIRLPNKATPQVKIITNEDVCKAIAYFSNDKHFLRYRAFILLMSSSGIRPSEAWQLRIEDIDLENRKVYIRVDSMHHTKTGHSRISFFDNKTQIILTRYLKYNKNKRLFNESMFMRKFRHAPVKVKELRKFFSQEFTRLNGNQLAKEILLGHSLNNNIDGLHYCSLSEQNLKEIYDKVMN